MRLTLYTDFALRVLIQVGLNDGKLTTINDVAQSFGISKSHLMKVVNDLSQKGYLDTVRGRNGGIRLVGEPRHINIGQVVRDTEDQLDVVSCLGRKGYCPIQRICVLRGALRDATEAFLAVLDTYTLADLIKPQKALSALLLDRREVVAVKLESRIWTSSDLQDGAARRYDESETSFAQIAERNTDSDRQRCCHRASNVSHRGIDEHS
jgi:Rrf2 family transcriptional regulator, nitric oxide-sensitive transcriptional repressor